mmetsp:Transcript_17314/g.36515  ORF Transcript_17314/g.36515 Transcript_17314/m.36515 type:complete len:231 (-) Transcript_17314:2802-3494(-)
MRWVPCRNGPMPFYRVLIIPPPTTTTTLPLPTIRRMAMAAALDPITILWVDPTIATTPTTTPTIAITPNNMMTMMRMNIVTIDPGAQAMPARGAIREKRKKMRKIVTSAVPVRPARSARRSREEEGGMDILPRRQPTITARLWLPVIVHRLRRRRLAPDLPITIQQQKILRMQGMLPPMAMLMLPMLIQTALNKIINFKSRRSSSSSRIRMTENLNFPSDEKIASHAPKN